MDQSEILCELQARITAQSKFCAEWDEKYDKAKKMKGLHDSRLRALQKMYAEIEELRLFEEELV